MASQALSLESVSTCLKSVPTVPCLLLLSTPPSLRCPLLESSQPIFQQLTETSLKKGYSPQSLWASLLP